MEVHIIRFRPLVAAFALLASTLLCVATNSEAGQTGVASWHAARGTCRTASKRPWNGAEMVAAHRSLPMGTKVRVINLANGHEAIVKITDRGPYCRGRIIDVSRCAATQLGLLARGTARVWLEPVADDAS